MDISEVTFVATNYANFELQSGSTYLVCASLVVLANLAAIHQILIRKCVRASDMALLSLALTDLCYEAVTTPLFLQCDYSKTSRLQKCDVLYCTYTILNLSTVFHILIETIGYFSRTYRLSYRHDVGLALSISAWCSSIFLVYITASSKLKFLNEDAMVLLGQFKAFGYFMFLMVLGAITVTITVAKCIVRVLKNVEHVSKEPLDKFESSTTSPQLQNSEKDGLVFRGIVLVFCVGCFGSLIIGDGNELTKSLEIMRFFEFIRFAARILSQFNLLCGFTNTQSGLNISRKTVKSERY